MSDFRFGTRSGPVEAMADVPGSKSLTNRALILAALADGNSVLRGILLAEDTRLMIESLRALGIPITVDDQCNTAEVTGCGGHIPANEANIFCGNSGTTMRFCTALAALSREGRYRLDGVARMRRRPIGALADALQSLGAGIEYEDETGFPPLTIHAHGLRGGHIAFTTPASTQYVSALLMVAPYASSDVLIDVSGQIPSLPFLKMTVGLMEQFGVPVLSDGPEEARSKSGIRFIVETPQRYRGSVYSIEPDATNAMYFLSIPAVVGGRVTVKGLGTGSLQGDVGFLSVLEQIGCDVHCEANRLTVSRNSSSALRAVDIDLGCMPDLAPTLAVLAMFAEGTTTIRNVANLRIKESDRLAALASELRKLGAAVEERPEGLQITPPPRLNPATIETYDDHRIAMSFALAGLRCPGLTIRNIECTDKTFPGFFEQWKAISSLS